jgi:hypothetical protein
MSETVFASVLKVFQETGPEGIRTDVLAKQAGCKPLVLNNYLKRHRQDGQEIHTLLSSQAPAMLYGRLEWLEAAKAARAVVKAEKTKARERKRSLEKSELAAVRRQKAKAQADAKAKTLAEWKAKAETKEVKVAPKVHAHVGKMPSVQELPHQRVYARHQLVELPPGFVSVLNPAECRPWAKATAP